MISRLDVLKILHEYTEDMPVISTCGATSREWASIGRRDNHLYIVDSMGLTPSVAIGVSLAISDKPFKKCIALEGDGGVLMNPNALSSAAYLQPEKWLLIILDNECFASTGGQKSIAGKLNVGGVAEGHGLKTFTTANQDQFRESLEEALELNQPVVIHAKISQENQETPFINDDPAVLGHKFSEFITERESL